MTHPHQLHATTALWSLRRARAALDAALTAAAGTRDDGLRSSVYGQRHALGGATDPVATLAINTSRPGSPYERVADTTRDTLRWLGDRIAPGPGDPLDRIANAIPTLRPATTANLTRWLGDLDTSIRRELRMLPDEQALPGNPPCPACRARVLRVHAAAPNPADWTATCSTYCTCHGDRCPCGMPTRAHGVTHIWTRSDLFTAIRIRRRAAA